MRLHTGGRAGLFSGAAGGVGSSGACRELAELFLPPLTLPLPPPASGKRETGTETEETETEETETEETETDTEADEAENE